jgi:rubredoxin
MEHAEDITKAPDVSFIDIHPTRTAGGTSGLDKDESDFIRCKQCGFIFDKSKHPKGSGYGNETTVSITTISGGTANSKDPTVGPGCPFCGSSEYD